MSGVACGDDGCHPLTPTQAESLWASAQRAKEKRAADMPDERAAISNLFAAFIRLNELGWRDASYAPRGKRLELIECGSTGIHDGYRDEHGFWIHSHDDTWPSKPVLFRLHPIEVAAKADPKTVPETSLHEKDAEQAPVNPSDPSLTT